MSLLTFSKSDAARGQLETAIRLYFCDGDPVSIHTLAGAANELLRGLSKSAGADRMLKDRLMSRVPPELQPQMMRRANEAQNFFKHADRDVGRALEFETEQTEWLLLDCCWTYRRLIGERFPELAAFEMWSKLTWGKSFMMNEHLERALQFSVRDVSTMSRAEFFELFGAAAHLVCSNPTDA